MDHGDAHRPLLQKLWRFLPPHPGVFLLWSPDSCRSADHGRLVSVLTRSAVTLVSDVIVFSLVCINGVFPWEIIRFILLMPR